MLIDPTVIILMHAPPRIVIYWIQDTVGHIHKREVQWAASFFYPPTTFVFPLTHIQLPPLCFGALIGINFLFREPHSTHMTHRAD